MNNYKKLILLSIIFVGGFAAKAQPDLLVHNNTYCDIKVWGLVYDQNNSDPCDADCNNYIRTEAYYLISGLSSHTFTGTPSAHAWGRVYMEASGGWNDYDGDCGSSSHPDDCTNFPPPNTRRDIELTKLSCDPTTLEYEIDEI